ncbi:MAG: hypothetical protein AAF961_11705 [Planctomycetota bacterium]
MKRVAAMFRTASVIALPPLMSCQVDAGEPKPFVNYVRFVPSGPTTFDLLHEEGPLPAETGLPSLPGTPLPGWDGRAVATIATGGGPPTVDDASLIATLPVYDTLTSVAYDQMGRQQGRIELLGIGNQKLDLNAAHAVVDPQAGTIAVQFGGPLLQGQPSADFSVVAADGIYASEARLLGDGLSAYAGGKFLLPLDDDPSTTLQQNILGAFTAGQIVGVDVVGFWTGSYVPEPASGVMLAVAASPALTFRRLRRSRKLASVR